MPQPIPQPPVPPIEQNPPDFLLLKMQTALTKEDYASANRLFMRAKQHGMRVFSIVFIVLLAILIGILTIFSIASREFPPEIILLSVLLLLFLLLSVLQRKFAEINAKKVYDKQPYLHNTIQCWIFDDHIELSNDGAQERFEWNQLEGGAEDAEMMMLWCGVKMIVFPAHALEPSAAAYLHNLLIAKLGGKFRFFMPTAACGTLVAPQGERSVSALHMALSTAAAPQGPHDFPPFVADVPRRLALKLANLATAIIVALICGPILAFTITDQDFAAFRPGAFFAPLLLFETVFAAMLLLSAWTMRKNLIGTENRLRIVLLPCGFGTDTGKSNSLVPWERIRITDTGRAFLVFDKNAPFQAVKILRSDLTCEAFEELRRLLARCCPEYQSKNGVVPR